MATTEIQAEWLKRLRSGKIKKNTNVLHSKDGSMCAIGVLCEILYEQGLVERLDLDSCYSYNNSVSLPTPVARHYMGNVRMMPIINMNETSSFKKIADYIEGELG